MKKKTCNSAFLLAVIYALSGIILLTLNTGCSERQDKPEPEKSNQSDGQKYLVIQPVQTDSILKYKLNRPVTYKPLAVKEIKSIPALKKMFGPEAAVLILALNRLDTKDFWRADTLIVPDTVANILSYSPYPYIIESARSIPKLILISRKIQAFAAYENGTLVRWGPTSTGRKAKPTPPGLFSMNWKSKKTISTIDSSWILPFYFNFNNKEGVAIHQFDMPGYPASHACVRLLEQDAKWFYYWAEQWILGTEGAFTAHGTPVIIFDEYGWGKRRPWRKLLEDPSAAAVSLNDIDSLMNNYSPVIKERIEKRQEIIAEIKRKKEEKQIADINIEPTSVPNVQFMNARNE